MKKGENEKERKNKGEMMRMDHDGSSRKEGYIYPVVLHCVFVGILTGSMVGATLFCMLWFETNQIPLFSDAIKHAPTNYLWDLSITAFMPMWYLTVYINYLCICWVNIKINKNK